MNNKPERLRYDEGAEDMYSDPDGEYLYYEDYEKVETALKTLTAMVKRDHGCPRVYHSAISLPCPLCDYLEALERNPVNTAASPQRWTRS